MKYQVIYAKGDNLKTAISKLEHKVRCICDPTYEGALQDSANSNSETDSYAWLKDHQWLPQGGISVTYEPFGGFIVSQAMIKVS